MAKNVVIEIIHDSVTLNAAIKSGIKSHARYHDLLHVCFLSALYHAAEFGQCDPLNRVYSYMMTTNYQTVCRQFVNRVHMAVGGINFEDYTGPEGEPLIIDEDIVKGAVENGTFLGYGKNGFFVKKDTAQQRDVAMDLIKNKLLKPDGRVWRRFYARNVLAEQKAFGLGQLIKKLDALIKESKGENERSLSSVRAEEIVELQKVRDLMVYRQEQGAATPAKAA